MARTTDPARELAELCRSLVDKSKEEGAEFLSKKFAVSPWSEQFFQILFQITKRFNKLKEIILDGDFDSDIKEEIISKLNGCSLAFSRSGLINNWMVVCENYLNDNNISAVKMASISLKKTHSYEFLEDQEIEDLNNIIEEFISILKEKQVDDLDFCRQAMIDGLTEFKFRLEKMRWLDVGYAIESLRGVVSAYFVAKEKFAGSPDLNASAAFSEIQDKIVKIFKILKVTKDASDISKMMISGAIGLYALSQSIPKIAGYLTFDSPVP